MKKYSFLTTLKVCKIQQLNFYMGTEGKNWIRELGKHSKNRLKAFSWLYNSHHGTLFIVNQHRTLTVAEKFLTPSLSCVGHVYNFFHSTLADFSNL